MNPEHRGNESKTSNRQTKASLPARKTCLFLFFFFFFFLGGKDIHYTSAMIATSRVCDVHHKPERPKQTTHLELVKHES